MTQGTRRGIEYGSPLPEDFDFEMTRLSIYVYQGNSRMRKTIITASTFLLALTLLTACGGGLRDYSYEKSPRVAAHKSGMGTVTGRVLALSDDTPAVDVTMTLIDPATGASRREVTGSDGEFVFQNVEPGTYNLLRGTDIPPETSDQLQIKAKPDTTTRVMRWQYAISRDSISGRVVDENGQPMAGVKVTTNPGAYGSNMNPITGADGRWRHFIALNRKQTLEHLGDAYRQRISFALPGYEAAPLVDPEPTTTAPLDIVMTPRPSVDVEVVDQSGNPVPEIAFAALVQDGKHWDLATNDGDATTSISEDGRHRLANLTRREFGLVVRELNGPRDSRRSAFVIVPAGMDREPVRAVLEAPITISGRVLRADGSPAKGATVRLRDVAGWASRRWVDAGEGGAYEIAGVTRGPYRLRAEWGGESMGPLEHFTVFGADSVVDLQVPTALTIQGRVIGLDGKKLGGAALTVLHPAGGFGREGALAPKVVTTAPDGTFEVSGLEQDDLQVRWGVPIHLTVKTAEWEHRVFRKLEIDEQGKALVIDLSDRSVVTARPQFDPSIRNANIMFHLPNGEIETLWKPSEESTILLPKGNIQPYLLWYEDAAGVTMLPAFDVKGNQENVFAPVVTRHPVAFEFETPSAAMGKLTVSGADHVPLGLAPKSRYFHGALWNKYRSTTDVSAGQLSAERQLVPGRYTATYEAADGARWRSAEFTVPLEGGSVRMVREGN